MLNKNVIGVSHYRMNNIQDGGKYSKAQCKNNMG